MILRDIPPSLLLFLREIYISRHIVSHFFRLTHISEMVNYWITGSSILYGQYTIRQSLVFSLHMNLLQQGPYNAPFLEDCPFFALLLTKTPFLSDSLTM